MVDIINPQWWTDEERRAWDEIAPTSLDILFAGGMSGHDALPPGARVLVDWDVFNEDAIDWLNGWRGGVFREMNQYTRERSLKEISDWIRSGEHLDVLSKRLEPLFGSPRARRIAVTEVTRMYSEGNQMAWKASGLVSGKRWNTANDELVCPICGPLHGMETGIDENGFTTEEFGMGLTGPPAHPNCRCYLTPVTQVSDLERELERELEL